MTKSKFILCAALVAALPLSGCTTNPETGNGCTTNPETGNKRISKAAIGGLGGALGGYLLGDLVGGRRDRTEKILGAGIGAVAGAGVGYYMDQQEKKLRKQTAGSGVNVIREGDNLVLDMPADVTFPVNSYAVQPQFGETLASIAGTLREYEKTYVDVLGHTDSTGSDAYSGGCAHCQRRAICARRHAGLWRKPAQSEQHHRRRPQRQPARRDQAGSGDGGVGASAPRALRGFANSSLTLSLPKGLAPATLLRPSPFGELRASG